MLRIITIALTIILSTTANAESYGNYDLRQALVITQTATGNKYSVDTAYVDSIVSDLSRHAINYPPTFDNDNDKQRAIKDTKIISGIFNELLKSSPENYTILIRSSTINVIGHNLDIPSSADRAAAAFKAILQKQPDDQRANYMYGNFLASTGRPDEALPLLQKARALGVVDASYSIGMTYLSLGKPDLALESFERYKQVRPTDRNVDRIIDAIRSGKVQLKKSN